MMGLPSNVEISTLNGYVENITNNLKELRSKASEVRRQRDTEDDEIKAKEKGDEAMAA